jgi:hypothetical protein
MSQLTAIRLLDADEPAAPLLEAVRDLAEGQPNEATYQVKPASFRQVPNAPFAYWVSENIRGLFAKLPPFEGDGRTAKQGLSTADDFRFVHTRWETPSNDSKQTWFPFAKGGSYSPFYADVYLKVNWGKDGIELDTFSGSVIRNADFHFRPGLTWIRRTKGFCPQVLARGVIFSDAAQAAFNPGKELATVSLFSSRVVDFIIKLTAGRTGDAVQFMPGMVSNIPFKLPGEFESQVNPLAHSAWSLKRSTDTANQTSHAFYAPALSPGQFGSRRKDLTSA